MPEQGYDADAALAEILGAYKRWTEADPHTDEEWYAAATALNGIEALHRHLSTGGKLPVDWDVCPV